MAQLYSSKLGVLPSLRPMPNTTTLHIPSNKVRDIERYIHAELSALYPEGELSMFVLMLFEAFLGWDKTHLLLNRESTINQSDLLKFHWAVEDLKQFRPIQHIIGYTDFCDLRLSVSQDVLIPRPETEEIVRLVAHQFSADSRLQILDVCTGSGCIALGLKSLYPQSVVYGLDVSPKALSVARANAQAVGLPVSFVECDVLAQEPQLPVPQLDIIISNPPYIRHLERADMSSNVLDYEPELALFVPDHDPLIFYRAIAQYALAHLSPQGLLAFEINEHLGPETCELLQGLGFVPQLIQDFRGCNRCILARLS